ncbi:hypothetical protein EVG20_g1234 [Dentipellis fragilis]|uniref:Uncharacterized protein n=1 Tax=Dentipellis fragilis TaxID=205917 RepID=A0A4Y9ZCA3_9AGAM|nr:hypothetical protein EVG20_g1234 [Dentipellis fragilis]
MGISLVEAEILALFLETLLYGVSVSLYCGLLLSMKKKGTSTRTIMISVASVLLALATAHILIDIIRAMNAFVYAPHGALAYYNALGDPLVVTKTALYVTQMLLGDSVIIWRCYVVFDRQLLAITVPGTVLLFNGGVGYYVCYALSQAEPGESIFHTADRWITTFFALTMTINILCTCAILWRMYVTSGFAMGSSSLLWPVVVAVIETGAVYSLAILSVLIAYLKKSNGQYPARDIVQPLVGIVFILIALQIRHFGPPMTPDNNQSSASIIPRYHWTPQGPRTATNETLYPLQLLAVQITEETTVAFGRSGGKKDVEEARVSAACTAGLESGFAGRRNFPELPVPLYCPTVRR